jgi:hypothetical protein
LILLFVLCLAALPAGGFLIAGHDRHALLVAFAPLSLLALVLAPLANRAALRLVGLADRQSDAEERDSTE